jgi:uncharacterized protein
VEQVSPTIAALWRYPVKSMQGEALDEAHLTEHGVLGDRAYALLDHATGTIATAKHPRRWPALIACVARFVQPPHPGQPLPPVAITLPGGEEIRSDEQDCDARLSRTFGRAVSLVAAGEGSYEREVDRTPLDIEPQDRDIRREPLALGAAAGTFFDYGPLHLLSTATLAFFQARQQSAQFDPRRFRPNVLLAAEGATCVEHAWLGKPLVVGRTVELLVIDPSPRCVVTTLAQGNLPRDLDVLRTITMHSAAPSVTLAPGVVFPAVAGVYARVVRGGLLRRGDAVRLLGNPA